MGGEFAIMPEPVSETDLGNAVARRNDREWRAQVTVPQARFVGVMPSSQR